MRHNCSWCSGIIGIKCLVWGQLNSCSLVFTRSSRQEKCIRQLWISNTNKQKYETFDCTINGFKYFLQEQTINNSSLILVSYQFNFSLMMGFKLPHLSTSHHQGKLSMKWNKMGTRSHPRLLIEMYIKWSTHLHRWIYR